MFFSWITSKLLKLGEQAWHHRVPLVKPDGSICFLSLKGQFWNLTSGHARSRSQCDLSKSCCISGDAPWRDEHCGTNTTSLRRGSRISARGGRQGIDDLIWSEDERFLTYANTDLQLFKMFIAILYLNVVEQPFKGHQFPLFLPLRRWNPHRRRGSLRPRGGRRT